MKKILVLNWKHHWVDAWQDYLDYLADPHSSLQAIVAPPHPMLALMAQQKRDCLIAQSAGDQPLGSHTGAIGASYLKKIGVPYALIGHSESRKQGMSNAQLERSYHSCLKHNIHPILCCGETHPDLLIDSLVQQLSFLTTLNQESVSIAYEPVWAIGTSEQCSVDRLGFIYSFIKKLIPECTKLNFMYGGGLRLPSALDLLEKTFISGLLIGKMSLDLNQIKQLMSYSLEKAA